MRPWCRAAVTDGSALQAVAVHRRFGFSFYDAALVAAALEYGCNLFLSEDLSHGQRVDTLQIIDPFRAAPSDILDFPQNG
ncbi:MAG TPA: hypothetical protein VLA00_08735 [Xanthobacteraceae bacterium]|nr:hypothetical protein [Xanthobacteraceae bacterium]